MKRYHYRGTDCVEDSGGEWVRYEDAIEWGKGLQQEYINQHVRDVNALKARLNLVVDKCQCLEEGLGDFVSDIEHIVRDGDQ